MLPPVLELAKDLQPSGDLCGICDKTHRRYRKETRPALLILLDDSVFKAGEWARQRTDIADELKRNVSLGNGYVLTTRDHSKRVISNESICGVEAKQSGIDTHMHAACTIICDERAHACVDDD